MLIDRQDFDTFHDSRSCHRAGQPVNLARCLTPRISTIPRRYCTAERKETAHQPVTAEHLNPALTALAATTEPLEDHGQLRGDGDLYLANAPAGVFGQIDEGPLCLSSIKITVSLAWRLTRRDRLSLR
jgi:hypothetical protein